MKKGPSAYQRRKLWQGNARSDMLTLYHGTCENSAKRLLAQGFTSGNHMGGNMGRPGLLYLTNVPENALWFAEQMGCNTILAVQIPLADLIVDPDDGIGESAEDELLHSRKSGLPAYLATKQDIPASRIQRYGKQSAYRRRKLKRETMFYREGWSFKCLDRWWRYRGEEATDEEAEELDRIQLAIETETADFAKMELYQEAVYILHDIAVRQFSKQPGVTVVRAELKWLQGLEDGEGLDIEGEPTFGYTEIEYRVRGAG